MHTETALIGAEVYELLYAEDVLFKSESDQSREEIASFLRTVVENLDSEDAITL